MTKDELQYNCLAWNQYVHNNNIYTQSVSSEEIQNAKAGKLKIKLSRYKYVPDEWLPKDLNNIKVLALAAGGGQQAVLLSAAGAEVTLVDNSDLQLESDIRVAERENLSLKVFKGNMMDLSMLQEEYFDIVINPISSLYINDVKVMYKGVSRVIKKNGIFMSGFMNPLRFAVDYSGGKMYINKKIPFNCKTDLDKYEIAYLKMKNTPLTFGHSLEELINGQIENGFYIEGFYEDKIEDSLDEYIDTSIVTLARKGKV